MHIHVSMTALHSDKDITNSSAIKFLGGAILSFKTPPNNMKLTFSWLVLGLMSSVTFVGMLSELMPSGILPQMAEGLDVSESQIGFLVGVYALASALCAIPLISATLTVNRKKLLLILLIGFAISNIVVAVSSSYYVLIASRILGGICAGIMWPMIAAYGTRLVPENVEGKAITVIMAGNTLGVSLGLPLMTTIGITFGWRTEFLVVGLLVAMISILSYFILPSVEGEKLSRSNSPLAVLKLPSMLIVLLLTFLSVVAHYGIYTYITLLVELIDFIGGIELALLIFGVGSVISVIVTAKYIDAYLRLLIVFMFSYWRPGNGFFACVWWCCLGFTYCIFPLGYCLWAGGDDVSNCCDKTGQRSCCCSDIRAVQCL